MIEIVFHLVVLREAPQVRRLHLDEVIYCRLPNRESHRSLVLSVSCKTRTSSFYCTVVLCWMLLNAGQDVKTAPGTTCNNAHTHIIPHPHWRGPGISKIILVCITCSRKVTNRGRWGMEGTEREPAAEERPTSRCVVCAVSGGYRVPAAESYSGGCGSRSATSCSTATAAPAVGVL